MFCLCCALWILFCGSRTGSGFKTTSLHISSLRMTNMTDAICWVGPGLNFALTSVWLTCAMSLAVFDIEKYVDGFGNVVEPKIHYSDGIIR